MSLGFSTARFPTNDEFQKPRQPSPHTRKGYSHPSRSAGFSRPGAAATHTAAPPPSTAVRKAASGQQSRSAIHKFKTCPGIAQRRPAKPPHIRSRPPATPSGQPRIYAPEPRKNLESSTIHPILRRKRPRPDITRRGYTNSTVMLKMGNRKSMIPNSLGGQSTGAEIANGLLGRSGPAKFGCALLVSTLALAILVGPRFWIQQSDSLGIGQAVTGITRVATVSIVSLIAMGAAVVSLLRGERLWILATMLLLSGVAILKILA